jgi:hypothetical protein
MKSQRKKALIFAVSDLASRPPVAAKRFPSSATKALRRRIFLARSISSVADAEESSPLRGVSSFAGRSDVSCIVNCQQWKIIQKSSALENIVGRVDLERIGNSIR